ncbi:MAG: AraC family transcriptional regulator [Rhodospirillaceae bacterium]|nr:AraC family transcriptional regulator [Rhodospirillaceae bacterium]
MAALPLASAKPFADFAIPRHVPAFETSDIGAVCMHMSQDNGTPVDFRVEIDSAFSGFRHTRINLERTKVDYIEIDCSSGHRFVSQRPNESELFVYLPLRGTLEVDQGGHRVDVAPGQIALVGSAGSYTQKRYHGVTELIVIQIPRRTLASVLADEYGGVPGGFVEFEPRIVIDLAAVPTLARYVGMLCRDAAEADPLLADRATARSCERTLMVLMARSFPHSLSAELGRARSPALPYYVRRAQEFLHANAARTITVAELIAVAGVSNRALYYGFERYLGATPMKYLRQVRLESARTALRKARGSDETVTDVAMAAGYSNLSRFCRDYRALFGETPSATLREG